MAPLLLSKCRTYLSGYLLDVAEIEFAAAQARRSDAYEGEIGSVDGGTRVRSGMETAGSTALRYELIHARFKNRTLARLQHFNLDAVNVDTDYSMSQMGKACRGYGTDVAQPKNADRRTHGATPALSILRTGLPIFIAIERKNPSASIKPYSSQKKTRPKAFWGQGWYISQRSG